MSFHSTTVKSNKSSVYTDTKKCLILDEWIQQEKSMQNHVTKVYFFLFYSVCDNGRDWIAFGGDIDIYVMENRDQESFKQKLMLSVK
jgi:hypothetical protein